MLHPGTGRGSPRLLHRVTACCAASVNRHPLCLRWARCVLATHLTPLEEVPLPAARCVAAAFVRHHCRPLPPRRCASALPDVRRHWLARRPSTSRRCSAGRSVAAPDRCQSIAALSFRGLCLPSRVLARLRFATRCVSASAHSASPTGPATTSLPSRFRLLRRPQPPLVFTSDHRCRPLPFGWPALSPGCASDSETVRNSPSATCPAIVPPEWLEGGPRSRTLMGFFQTSKSLVDTLRRGGTNQDYRSVHREIGRAHV